jgi:hypothetical protein
MAQQADVLIQAGHEHRTDPDQGSLGTHGALLTRRFATPVVCDEAARILREAGVSVIREDAFLEGGPFTVKLALFIHFDGNGTPCSSGTSVGYKPAWVDPSLSDKPAADAWKALYKKHWKFNFMPDNFTRNLWGYYGFGVCRTSDAELVIELGEITCPEQEKWLEPRLVWLGSLIAHFASKRIGKGNVPEPAPFQE